MIPDTDSTLTCGQCGDGLVSARNASAWCARCEWNLDLYDPRRIAPTVGWGWLDRRLFRLAFGLNRQQFALLSGRAVDRPAGGGARVVIAVASLVLAVAIVGLLVAGGWLVAFDFPSLSIVPGLLLIGVAVVIFPRFGRLPDGTTRLTREDAPTLFGLIDDVATATGAKSPQVVLVDASFNAFATSVGWRRRRVVNLGLPLWAILPPDQRVALLSHEMAHFSNGDVRRGLLTAPVYVALGNLVDLTRPTRGRPMRQVGISLAVAQAMVYAVMWLLSRFTLAAMVLLLWIGRRDTQRAEYYADQLAAATAGSVGVAGLCDGLNMLASIEISVRSAARGDATEAAQWRAVADRVRSDSASQVAVLRQLSIRESASLFDTHPPSGLRAMMIESRPANGGRIVLDQATSDRIDAELGRRYSAIRREMAWSE